MSAQTSVILCWSLFCFLLLVREKIGPIATPDFIQNAPALPKTRSGNNFNSASYSSSASFFPPLKLLSLLPLQGRSWGESSVISPAMRRTWGTCPPWPTPKWWRCCSVRGVKLRPEQTRARLWLDTMQHDWWRQSQNTGFSVFLCSLLDFWTLRC